MAPGWRALTSASAARRSATAASTVASAGAGLGKAGLTVIALTTSTAYAMKASMRLGSARTARLLIVSFVVLSMRITSYSYETLAFWKRWQTFENRRRHATERSRTVVAWNRTLANCNRTFRDWLRTFLLRARTFFAPARSLNDPNRNPAE